MTGNGGDNVFYNSRSIRPIFDRFRHQGLSPGLLETAGDIATITRTTQVDVMWHVLKHSLKIRAPYRSPVDTSLLTADAHRQARALRFTHPWIDPISGRAPGKAGHIAMLLSMQNHVEGYLRDADIPIVNPLVSQPIVELALAIPTWRMIEGGRDRSIVRHAFEASLPREIITRRRKGSPGSFALNVLVQNIDDVRQRLLDGRLVRAGYLDQGAIEAALAKGPGMGKSYMRLLALLDIEAWLQSWESLRADLASQTAPY